MVPTLIIRFYSVIIIAFTDIKVSLLIQNALTVLMCLLRVDVRYDAFQMLDIVLAVERAHFID